MLAVLKVICRTAWHQTQWVSSLGLMSAVIKGMHFYHRLANTWSPNLFLELSQWIRFESHQSYGVWNSSSRIFHALFWLPSQRYIQENTHSYKILKYWKRNETYFYYFKRQLCICVGVFSLCVYVYMCTTCACYLRRSDKWSDPLELLLQILVGYPTGADNRTCVL